MLKTGWIRLWIVLTCLVLLTTIVMSSFYVWGRDVCYRFISVTIADTASTDDRQLAERIYEEGTTKIFTGKYRYSPPLLTLEALAKRRKDPSVLAEVVIDSFEQRRHGCGLSRHRDGCGVQRRACAAEFDGPYRRVPAQ